MSLIYFVGSDLGDAALTWLDGNGNVIDYSSGYTFSATITKVGQSTPAFTKADGYTGHATAPNLTVQWATTGELNTLAVGNYSLKVMATRTSDTRQRIATYSLSMQ